MKHEHCNEHDNCTHEHEHEHDQCSCGHEHEHCSCGHGHQHDHSMGISCGCGHDHGHDHTHGSVSRAEVAGLITGAALFATALILEFTIAKFVLPICILAYIILGREVLISSAKNIAHGHVFDENFLMSIATLAAFCIGDFTEAVGVMLFYNIGELFEHISVDRSRRQIAEAVDMRPETVNLITADHDHADQGCDHNHAGYVNQGCDHTHTDHTQADHDHENHADHYCDHDIVGHGCNHTLTDHDHETIRVIPAADAKVGDLIQVNPGERIPLDGIVTEGEGLIDTSPITGEPTPVHVKTGMELLSGSINLRGCFCMKVTAPLEESMVTRILEAVESASESKPQIEKFITKFARIYTPIVVVLALLVAIVPPLVLGAAWKYWIVTAITFLVISCPCAMVISVPLAFFLGVGAASKAGILVRSTESLEALRKIKIVAMDKTGTLTKGVVEDAGLLEVDEMDVGLPEESFSRKTVSGDVPKDDAAEGVALLRKMGLVPAMLTGDRKSRAEEIGALVGIEPSEIRSELLPGEKLDALRELRDEYGEIMFVGDGINDAPVLAGADVGCAMGSGADAAIESADIVFMNSTVKSISQVIGIGRRTGRIAKGNIAFALAIKVLVLIMGFAGIANIWLAVFADTGVAMLCILNSLRLLGDRAE